MSKKIDIPKLSLPRTGAIYGIILFVVCFSLVNENYFSISNFTNIMRQSSVLCIITICSFLAIITHQTDLSVGTVSSLSAVAAAQMMENGMPLIAACVVGLAAAMTIGLLNGVLAGFTNIPTFIITLATMGIAESIGMVINNGTLRITSEPFKMLSGADIGFVPLPMILVFVFYLAVYYIMKYRRYGTYLYAVGGREESAVTSGINVKCIKVSVYLVNGLLAGFAGLLYAARLGSANPSQGSGLELDGICAAVLGGAALTGGEGTVFGAFLGAIAISILRNGMNILGWRTITQMMVIGFVLILILEIDVLRKRRERA